MPTRIEMKPSSDRELVLCLLINAPPEKVYRAWTDPNLLVQWFTPKPWSTVRAELDLRPGGTNSIVMKSPDGAEFPNSGVYLEVIPNKKLVLTDAFRKAWEPSEKPFMTATLTFEEQGGKTKYTARVTHWSVSDREQHEQMGFFSGWEKAAEQLEEVVSKL